MLVSSHLSMAGGPNAALEFAVRRIGDKTNIVAAAGNGGSSGDAAYPAAYPQVIAVAAVDARLRPYRNGTRGAYLELSAPGVGVMSASADGSRRSYTGTSFAVPFAVAAVLRARAITRGDAPAARALLRSGARDLGAAGPRRCLWARAGPDAGREMLVGPHVYFRG